MYSIVAKVCWSEICYRRLSVDRFLFPQLLIKSKRLYLFYKRSNGVILFIKVVVTSEKASPLLLLEPIKTSIIGWYLTYCQKSWRLVKKKANKRFLFYKQRRLLRRQRSLLFLRLLKAKDDSLITKAVTYFFLSDNSTINVRMSTTFYALKLWLCKCLHTTLLFST